MSNPLPPGGFGGRDGLERRLAAWASQLGRDRKYPWVGTGLIDDLKAASRALGADPDALFPPDYVPQPKPAEPEREPEKSWDEVNSDMVKVAGGWSVRLPEPEDDEFANWTSPVQDFDL